MKLSNYNFVFEYNDRVYIFNAFTNAFARINHDISSFLDNYSDNNEENGILKEALAPLLAGGFLLEDSYNEMAHLKLRNRMGRYSSRNFGLTIAPTLACNFRCSYCFEDPSTETMSSETVEAVYDYILKSLRNVDSLDICWYGGEPLLAMDTIERLSKKVIDLCRTMNIPYSADIISNGFLMTPDRAEKLANEMEVGFWQVTLDGPPQTHDARRSIKNSGEPTFDTILNNIENSHHFFRNVSIRINVDKTNHKDVIPLLDILEQRGLKGKVSVYFGQVQPLGSACPSFSHACLSTEEFAGVEMDLYHLVFERGFPVHLNTSLTLNVCMADKVNSYLIDPKGNLSKCWNCVGNEDEKVGSVFDDAPTDNYVLWLSFDPFDDEDCKKCNVLPLCMGSCVYESVVGKGKECITKKFNLIEKLKLKLLSKQKEKLTAGDPSSQIPMKAYGEAVSRL